MRTDGLPAVDATVRAATAGDELAFIEAALAAPVTRPSVRVWQYTRPAVVLGLSQRPDPSMQQRAHQAGFDLCVRPSGGGAVLAGSWMLGATVVLPPRHPRVDPRITASFRWLGLLHAASLRRLGIPAAAVAEVEPAGEKTFAWACFARLSWWEGYVEGADTGADKGSRAKIVGLAQARRRNGVVLSSGVLLAPQPWEVLCNVLGQEAEHAAALAARTASCEQLLGAPVSATALATSLCEDLRSDLS